MCSSAASYINHRRKPTMKILLWIAMAIVLSIILIPVPASAQQVAQDQPKEAVKASITTQSEVKPIDVSGSWTWRIISTRRGDNEVTFDIQLTQDGADVVGSFGCLNCTRIVNGAPVKGTLRRDGKLELVRGDLAFSGFEVSLSQDGTEVSGTYTGRGNAQYRVEGKRK